MTRVALDTNILAYLAGVSRVAEDEDKIARARLLTERLSERCELVAPVQALGELFVVLRRSGAQAEEARSIILEFDDGFGSSATTAQTALSSADLVVDHKLQFWDALVVSAAIDAGCTLLLSEDMQDGFVARGMTIAQPFAAKPHSKLEALLES